MKLDVCKFTQSDCNNGLITLAIHDSEYQKHHSGEFIGTTTLDIQEPKKKKLVYQWVFQNQDNKLHLSELFYARDEKELLRGRLTQFKEGGKLFPLMESEREIEV